MKSSLHFSRPTSSRGKDLSQAGATELYAVLFVAGAAVQSIAGSATDRLGDRTVLVVTAQRERGGIVRAPVRLATMATCDRYFTTRCAVWDRS